MREKKTKFIVNLTTRHDTELDLSCRTGTKTTFLKKIKHIIWTISSSKLALFPVKQFRWMQFSFSIFISTHEIMSWMMKASKVIDQNKKKKRIKSNRNKNKIIFYTNGKWFLVTDLFGWNCFSLLKKRKTNIAKYERECNIWNRNRHVYKKNKL